MTNCIANDYRWKWMHELDCKMYDAFAKEFNSGWIEEPPTSILADLLFDDGSDIEVEINKRNEVNVFIYHKDEDNERLCPNIVEYIKENLASFEEYYNALCESHRYEDEWTSHGFRDEADYWHYRLG